MDEEYEVSRLEEFVGKLLDEIDSMSMNDKERDEKIKILCQVLDRLFADKKTVSSEWETQYKISKERELIELKASLERETLEFKERLESERRKEEEQSKAKDRELKAKEIKLNEIKTYLEAGMGIGTIISFVVCEILAHKRDVHDILPKAALHVKNNPLFSKMKTK